MGLIDDTLADAKRLVRLLEAPEPGLSTWLIAVHQAVAKVAGHLDGPTLLDLAMKAGAELPERDGG